MRAQLALFVIIAAVACHADAPAASPDSSVLHSAFPSANRPVAHIVSPRWSTEPARDLAHEADDVMAAAGVLPGMTVADIGAGEGYYTVKLAHRIGPKGRVLAEDIIPDVRDALAERVSREKLDTVSVRLGTPEDPALPEHSFDRIFMIHMYHEIASPLEFLWRIRPSLKKDGQIIVVDADRPTQLHGTPPKLLTCEFKSLGYHLEALVNLPTAGGYVARFKTFGERPAPEKIISCS